MREILDGECGFQKCRASDSIEAARAAEHVTQPKRSKIDPLTILLASAALLLSYYALPYLMSSTDSTATDAATAATSAPATDAAADSTATDAAPTRMPVLYIPHGGGPCFSMPDPAGQWSALRAYLEKIPETLAEVPRAILVVSAHWVTDKPTLLRTPKPDLLFDYYGFPRDTYDAAGFYPEGVPALASDVTARAEQLLGEAGIEFALDRKRNFDHGVFVPLSLAWSGADAPPMAQLSVLSSFDPARHIALGEALAPLRDEGVLIVASGMSYHNMRRAYSPGLNGEPFDEHLRKALAAPDHAARADALRNWEQFPGARDAHPPRAEEHLIPLHVAAGAARDATKVKFSKKFTAVGWRFSGVRFD